MFGSRDAHEQRTGSAMLNYTYEVDAVRLKTVGLNTAARCRAGLEANGASHGLAQWDNHTTR